MAGKRYDLFQGCPPAYITKRFDVKADGGKWGKEDSRPLWVKQKITRARFKYDIVLRDRTSPSKIRSIVENRNRKILHISSVQLCLVQRGRAFKKFFLA